MALKRRTKYTAVEILKASGIAKAEEQIGKLRVRIAGLAGINTPDHLIKIPEGVTEIDVLVGEELVKVPVELDDAEGTISEGAKVALDKKGAESVALKEAKSKKKTEVADTPQ